MNVSTTTMSRILRGRNKQEEERRERGFKSIGAIATQIEENEADDRRQLIADIAGSI
jgi:hypothetical protein